MENIELIITVRKVQGTHEQTIYYARVPARSVKRGRVALFGKRISRKIYSLIMDKKVSSVDVDNKFGFGGITSCWRVSVPLEVVENIKLF